MTTIQFNHLSKMAIVYIRQSSLNQVTNNTGSTAWQRSLADIAVDLGWGEDQIVVLSDQGRSAAYGPSRDDFEEVIQLIRTGQIGILLIVDQSRATRTHAEWGRLIDLLRYSGTLLFCNGQVYDVQKSGDEFVLSITQAMSMDMYRRLSDSMAKGRLNRAKTGKMRIPVPVGYIWQGDKLVIDHRENINLAIARIFSDFNQIGTVRGVVRHYRDNGKTIPKKDRKAPFRITWVHPTVDRVSAIIKNPVYTGLYVYGKSRRRWEMDQTGRLLGTTDTKDSIDDALVVISDHHEAFIGSEAFESNISKLKSNNFYQGLGFARPGRAIMQGLLVCGICGSRMTSTYQKHVRYQCAAKSRKMEGATCQSMRGEPLENIIISLVISALNPAQFTLLEKYNSQRILERDNEYNEILLEWERASEDFAHAARLAKLSGENADIDKRLAEKINEKMRLASRELAEANMRLRKNRLPDEYSEGDFGKLPMIIHLLSDALRSDFTKNEVKKELLRHLIKYVEVVRHGLAVRICIYWHTSAKTHATFQLN